MKRKIAIVHHFFVSRRGGEDVLLALCELFPYADLYFLVADKKLLKESLPGRNIYTSFVQHLPFAVRHFRKYFFLYPFSSETLNLKNYDLVISSTAGYAHGIRTNSAIHISYCHTPLRYVWHWREEFMLTLPKWQRPIISPFLNYIRKWEYKVSQKVEYFIANSTITKDRILKCYNRKCEIVFPPVDINSFDENINNNREDFFLYVSALVPYKKPELAIRVFNKLKIPLKIVGVGPLEKCLKKISNNNIEFLGFISKNELYNLYKKCKALIYTAEEDFGIIPVEAQSHGCPVIAYGKGGVLDTIIPNETGVFFYKQTEESLIRAIEKFKIQKFNYNKIRENSLRFSTEKFKENFMDFVYNKIEI